MSSRRSIIAMAGLIASIWISAIAIRKKNDEKTVFKENPPKQDWSLTIPDSNNYVNCCVVSIEECDTNPPLHRLYISDCGIPFYSYKTYNVGDSVEFYNAVPFNHKF